MKKKQYTAQELHFGVSLTQDVFRGFVFGESLDISRIPQTRLERLFHEVHHLTADALQPLARFQPQLVAHILDKIMLKSVAFISAVGYEMLLESDEFYALDKAGAAMALVQVADHLMDRGDSKMVTALEHYFEGHAHTDPEIQARSAILHAIATLAYDTSPDEGGLIAETMMAILRDELKVYQLSKEYARLDEGERERFIENYAHEIARLSIGNVGLRPGSYMIYGCYRSLFEGLPPLSSVMSDEALDLMSYFGEWAIRLWDDYGDRELDASESIYTNAYIINPFVEQNECLTMAYFEGIQNEGEVFNLINAAMKNSSKINDMLAYYLRSVSADLPDYIEAENHTYLAILRRIIEAGYINGRGDEAVSFSSEIISDYA